MKLFIILLSLISFNNQAYSTSALTTLVILGMGGKKEAPKPADKFALATEDINEKINKNKSRENHSFVYNTKGFDTTALHTYYRHKGYDVSIQEDNLVFDLTKEITKEKMKDKKDKRFFIISYMISATLSLLFGFLTYVAFGLDDSNSYKEAFIDGFLRMFLDGDCIGYTLSSFLPVISYFTCFMFVLVFFIEGVKRFLNPSFKQSKSSIPEFSC